MKKFLITVFGVLIASIFFTSCITALVMSAVNSDANAYNYVEVKDYEFPDGTVADIKIFQREKDLGAWMKNERENPSSPTNKFITRIEETSNGSIFGELTWKSEMLNDGSIQQMPYSYCNISDLGSISEYVTEKSWINAIYETERGIYRLVIFPITRAKMSLKSGHKEQFVYEYDFMPKIAYAPVPVVPLTPAKVTPVDLNNIKAANKQISQVSNQISDLLQWLDVKIACIGKYDMAYTGDFKTKNPVDYYNTSFIKTILASQGQASRGTATFEGCCFDYADYTVNEIKNNFSKYSSLGVDSFYMAGTFDNPNEIILYRIAEKGEYFSQIINNTPVVVQTRMPITAHDNVTHHAWVWIGMSDGSVYWIDPTWTDNIGSPVWGKVMGTREVQLPSDSIYFAR